MPKLYIAEKIRDNIFEIAGGAPGQEISWKVTAVRDDPFLHDHTPQVEQDKPAGEHGTYLYPHMGLDYQQNLKLRRRKRR